jgi:ectoine hydroxylase
MQLTQAQLERFDADGFLVLPDLFTADEIAVLRAALPALYAEETPANIREKGSGEVRTAMGLHVRHPVYGRLVRDPRLIEPAFQLLGEQLYVQQVKINTKAAFEGEVWQWHYDFATHHEEDGVAAPLALNLHVFLDDVSEFNGPLWFIPGSHRRGPVPAALDTETTSYPLWCVGRDTVAGLVGEGGIVSATGPAGTALIFGDCLVHASPPNLSPWDRRIFSLIVNPIANAYTKTGRPDYKHHRDLTPIATLSDDCLASPSRVAAQ